MFDVGHLEAVKIRLKALLTSELTPISEMSHTSAPTDMNNEFIPSLSSLIKWPAM